jgi:hypothetical protein
LKGVNEMGKLPEAARRKFGDGRYTKRPLVGAEKKAWRAAKKLWK